jgi:tetratricopeptide (TPR) repeat protein
VNRRLTALDHADFETFAAHDAIVEDIVTRIPHAALRWNAAFHRVETALLRGDLREAERLAEVAFALGAENGQTDALALYGAQLMAIRYHQGRFHEMSELIEQAIVDSPDQLVYHATLAVAYAFSNTRDRANRLLDEHLAGGLAMTFDLSWLVAHESWAIAAVLVGHRDVAELVHQRLAPYDDQLPSSHSSVLPVVAEVLGRLDHLLGRYADADRWFAQAMAMHTRLQSPLLVASTSAAWAALLADRDAGDDAVRARTLAEQALTAATAGGYGYTEADARAVLNRLR